jgi:hypothetical protein
MESQKKSKKSLALTKQEAIDILWRKGVLVWKLNSAQKKLHELFYKSNYKTPVFNLHRRFGKSRSLLVIALEYCLRTPGTTVHYACPTAVMATKIVIPEMRKLLNDCPDDLRPKYFKHDKAFEFPNGSKIQIEGCDDGNADRLRGTSTNLGIVDEAGFVKDLDYLINDILMPQTLTTKGRLVLSSTPPASTDHPFVHFVRKAELNDAYLRMNIMETLNLIKNDAKHLQHIKLEDVEIIRENQGEDSATWKREYMVEIISDMDRQVVPEFTDQLEKEVVTEWVRPHYFDSYVSMDPGLVDNTGVLFGYVDFNSAKLIIEDEFVVNGNQVTTENIASMIKLKEAQLWNREGITHKVYMRISDNEPILLNDLAQLHNMIFIPTRKDEKEAAINDLRIKIRQKKIIIHPRCKNLISQLKTAMWNKRRSSYERSDMHGHFDLVDCLLYMVRNVHWNRNPFPNQGYDLDTQFAHGRMTKLSKEHMAIKGIFFKKGNK